MTEILFSLRAAEMLFWGKHLSDPNEKKDVCAIEEDLDFGNLHHLDENFDGFEYYNNYELNRTAIEKLKHIKKTDGTVRIWLCPSNPGELILLMYICYALRDTKCRIICVQIPAVQMLGNAILRINSSDEAPFEVLKDNISIEGYLSEIIRDYFASEYERILSCPDNLRVNINGRIACLPEDTFDKIILSVISTAPTPASVIVGTVQTMINGLKISFILSRLQYLAQKGLLKYRNNDGTEFYSLSEENKYPDAYDGLFIC